MDRERLPRTRAVRLFMLAAVPVLMMLATRHGLAETAAESKAVTPTDGPIKLFNGQNLTGWTRWLVDTQHKDPNGVFSVRDKMIRISGDGFGYLSTKQAYKDYRLVVEFKWGQRNWRGREKNARDSGLFLHSVGPDGNSFDGNGAFKAAIECQIMQGAVGDFLLIKGKYANGQEVPVRATAHAANKRDADGWLTWKPDGKRVTLRRTGRVNWIGKDPMWKDVLGFRGRHDIENVGQTWNRLECICKGSRIRVSVNGKTVNEIHDAFPSSGKILLQCEGSEVFFRRVELHPLSKLISSNDQSGK